MTALTSLTLPNGSTPPNRLAKAAMEENMAKPLGRGEIGRAHV